jgi:hypothetical protein
MVTRSVIAALCALLLLAAVPALADAKPATPQLIDRAEHAGKLDRSRADLFRTYALAAPERLPAAYRSNAPWDGTLTLLQVRRDLPRLRRAERQEIQALLEAQAAGESCSNQGSNQTSVLDTPHFHITYSSVGAGLTAAGYGTSLEQAWQTEVDPDFFGWAAPPVLSANPPAGNRYHVRIDNLGAGLYGFVSPTGDHAGLVGNNPATSWNDVDAFATCMVLNDDYDGFPSSPQASLDSTTAHEFNHSIQFGYGALTGTGAPDDVFVEGGATWMEDEVQDAANDNRNYLWPLFQESMGEYGDPFPYPYWITFRGLTERYGTGVAGGAEQVMQDFWELTSKAEPGDPDGASNLDAMELALEARGTTLADAFHAYAIAVKFNRPCSGGYSYPYCLEEGPGYVSAAGPTVVDASVASVGGSASSSVDDNYALSWVALPASSGTYDVTLRNNSAAGQLRGTVACDTGSGLVLNPLPALAGGGQSRTLAGFNPLGCTARVLVVTTEPHTVANPASSPSRSFTVSTGSASSTMHTLSVTKTGSGTGVVLSNPTGISCGGDCSESYPSGTSVTLTATPVAGSTFTGWGGSCSGTGPCTVTMDGSRSVEAGFALVPDTTPPETTITGGPNGETNDPTPTFTFASSESGSTFTCQVDAGPVVGCASPFTTGALAKGPHKFSVSARDVAGNPDPTPATRDFTVTGTGSPDDFVAPSILLLRLRPALFRAAPSGPALISALTGTRVSLRLSEAARVTFRVSRLVPGRRVGGRCVRPTAGNRGAPSCTRSVLLRGRLVRELKAGTSRLRYRGRLAGRTLRPGRYVLVARARDAAGNLSSRRRARFGIVG